MSCRNIYLLSCVRQKRSAPTHARDLHTSPWFCKARTYIRLTNDLHDQAHDGHWSMYYHRPQPVPTTPCRGTKGHSATYGVSPQQVETGQLLQRSDHADPASMPELAVRFTCPRPPAGLDVSPISAKPGCPRTIVPGIKVSMAYNNGLDMDPLSLAAHNTS